MDYQAPDIEGMRRRAQQHVEQGAVTDAYRADREAVLRMLGEALATEIVCTLRYKRHYFMAQGIHAKAAAAEFLQHATQESQHADLIAARIVQLGGEPDLDPEHLPKLSHVRYEPGTTLRSMIEENLIAERVAIDSYKDAIALVGDGDTTTRRMVEEILAVEEEHAEDLVSLLRPQVTA